MDAPFGPGLVSGGNSNPYTLTSLSSSLVLITKLSFGNASKCKLNPEASTREHGGDAYGSLLLVSKNSLRVNNIKIKIVLS